MAHVRNARNIDFILIIILFICFAEFLRIQGKLQKYGTLLRYFSFVILTFLFLQVQAFSVDISSESLLPKSEYID